MANFAAPARLQKKKDVKIYLINPPWFTKEDNIWSYIRGVNPPLGLLNLAAYLEKAKVDVDIIDFQTSSWSWEGIERKVQSLKCDFFGITATTPIVNNAYRICDIIKYLHPSSKIILGGVHATALPEEALGKPAIDYVVRGEGEVALLSLIQGAPLDGIAGISYRENGKYKHVKPDGIIPDLDDLPFPAYHKINLSDYHPTVGSYKRLPAVSLLTTRGCMGKCTFCNSANIPLRVRNADNIFQEIEMLSRKYGIKEISFYDDTFVAYRKNIMRLCELIIKNKLDLTWSCFARTDCVNTDILKIMKRAGCHQIMYGIESAQKEILANIKKHCIDSRSIKQAIEITKKAGITVRCAFMFGSPGETEETIDDTIEYSIRLDPDIAIYNITTPYPGTEMFRWAKERGYLRTENWDDYDLSKPIMDLPTINGKVLTQKYRQAFVRFYFRPKLIFKKMFSIRFLTDLPILIKGMKSILNFACRIRNEGV